MAPRTKLLAAALLLAALLVIAFLLPTDAPPAPASSHPVPAGELGSTQASPTKPEAPAPPVERTEVSPPPTRQPSPSTQPLKEADSTPGISSEILIVKDLVFPGANSAPPVYESMDALVANLKDATDPNYWRGDDVDIIGEDSGYVTVKANSKMRIQVAEVLRDIRTLISARGRGR